MPFCENSKDNYLGVSLNLSPQSAVRLIARTVKTRSSNHAINLPNIGMTIPMNNSAPRKHFVQLGFHNNYQAFVRALDENYALNFLQSFPVNQKSMGGITRCFSIKNSSGNDDQVWAIICEKSHSPIFDKYILAHEEGHAAMLFGHEKELIDIFRQGYPWFGRDIIENETNEFKAILAGLIPFAGNAVAFNNLKQAMTSFNQHMDKDHQKALYFASTCRPNSA